MTTDCGHPLCELIGGPCSLITGRSRGCTPGLTAKTITPAVFDEVRALLAVIDARAAEPRDVVDARAAEPARDERVHTAANRLAAIIRAEAREDRHLLAQARSDEPDLVAPLEALCTRRR